MRQCSLLSNSLAADALRDPCQIIPSMGLTLLYIQDVYISLENSQSTRIHTKCPLLRKKNDSNVPIADVTWPRRFHSLHIHVRFYRPFQIKVYSFITTLVSLIKNVFERSISPRISRWKPQTNYCCTTRQVLPSSALYLNLSCAYQPANNVDECIDVSLLRVVQLSLLQIPAVRCLCTFARLHKKFLISDKPVCFNSSLISSSNCLP